MSVEPTLGEVIRTLERIEQEFTRRLNELTDALGRVVTVDVYDAHRSATNDRIDNIRGEINAVRNEAREEINELRSELGRERTERRADRRMVVGTAMAAALSLIVTIVGAVLLAALGLK